MASELKLLLPKDGAIATVRVIVTLPEGTRDREGRMRDLENILCGGTAGVAKELLGANGIDAEVTEGRASHKGGE